MRLTPGLHWLLSQSIPHLCPHCFHLFALYRGLLHSTGRQRLNIVRKPRNAPKIPVPYSVLRTIVGVSLECYMRISFKCTKHWVGWPSACDMFKSVGLLVLLVLPSLFALSVSADYLGAPCIGTLCDNGMQCLQLDKSECPIIPHDGDASQLQLPDTCTCGGIGSSLPSLLIRSKVWCAITPPKQHHDLWLCVDA